MTNGIVFKTLHTHEEFTRVQKLERAIWNTRPEDTVSRDVMQAVTHNGGVLIGAEMDEVLVGFSFGLPARRGDQWLLWSHSTGVSKGYQGSGIGFGLKQEQRRWALEHDYPVIGWTFDPMQRGNANFNLHRLGAAVSAYIIDAYGEMVDDINAGMRSDRFEAMWDLQDERVVVLSEGRDVEPLTSEFPEEAFLLRLEDDVLITQSVNPDARWGFVEIPLSLGTLKRDNLETARAWQLALREVMVNAFAEGYAAVDFVTQSDRCWYVLHKP